MHDNDNLTPALQHDLATIRARFSARRQVLTWLSAASVNCLAGRAFAQGPFGGFPGTSRNVPQQRLPNAPQSGSGAGTATTPGSGIGASGVAAGDVFSANGACIADPTETNGPYPSDGSNTVNGVLSNILSVEGALRSDIRSSFGTSWSAAAGVPVTLTLNLVNVNDNCAPLTGYTVYIWHCDAAGKYSLYDLPTENYLRGVQVADTAGQVKFTTIYPGCYTGRYPHIHFEVYPSLSAATNYRNAALTSQLAMPADASAAVYANVQGYATSASAFTRVSVAGDNVFGNNSAAQIEAQTLSLSGTYSGGYAAVATIGLVV